MIEQDNQETNKLIKGLHAGQSALSPDTEDTLFCRSLALQMSNLPPFKRAFAKLKIQETMYHIFMEPNSQNIGAPGRSGMGGGFLPPSQMASFTTNGNTDEGMHFMQASPDQYSYQQL